MLEAAARRAVEAWAEAVDGADAALERAATPAAAHALLYPRGESTRLVVRGPRLQALRIVAVDADAQTFTVEADVHGRRYLEDRDTVAVIEGSKDRATTFTERWTLALADDPATPWRIVATAAGGLALLLAVPNVSEGRDAATLDAIGAAFVTGGARLLDVHTDPDHHRSVFTLAGSARHAPRGAARGRPRGGRADRPHRPRGRPPARRGRSTSPRSSTAPTPSAGPPWPRRCCSPTTSASDLQPPGLSVRRARGRAYAREPARPRGAGRPRRPTTARRSLHPTAGATLVAARAPLVAFNVELAPPATLEDARRIAADIREGGEHGLPGLRALGLQTGHAIQVSTNIEDHTRVSAADVVAAVARHAPVAQAELVGPRPATQPWKASMSRSATAERSKTN